jgi:protein-S-isoprenylcysteine O-methyltransferase Ste14
MILHGKMLLDNEPLLGPILKTLLFTLLVPGTVIVYVPYTLAVPVPALAFSRQTILAAVVILLGAAGYFATAFRFAVVGRGTPAPIAPTKTLVASGLHRYVRNPMYIAVLLVVAGEAVLYHSWAVARYAAFLFLAFHLFVLLYEEPTLRRQFGNSYVEYCARTRRWLPRLPSPL